MSRHNVPNRHVQAKTRSFHTEINIDLRGAKSSNAISNIIAASMSEENVLWYEEHDNGEMIPTPETQAKIARFTQANGDTTGRAQIESGNITSLRVEAPPSQALPPTSSRHPRSDANEPGNSYQTSASISRRTHTNETSNGESRTDPINPANSRHHADRSRSSSPSLHHPTRAEGTFSKFPGLPPNSTSVGTFSLFKSAGTTPSPCYRARGVEPSDRRRWRKPSVSASLSSSHSAQPFLASSSFSSPANTSEVRQGATTSEGTSGFVQPKKHRMVFLGSLKDLADEKERLLPWLQTNDPGHHRAFASGLLGDTRSFSGGLHSSSDVVSFKTSANAPYLGDASSATSWLQQPHHRRQFTGPTTPELTGVPPAIGSVFNSNSSLATTSTCTHHPGLSVHSPFSTPSTYHRKQFTGPTTPHISGAPPFTSNVFDPNSSLATSSTGTHHPGLSAHSLFSTPSTYYLKQLRGPTTPPLSSAPPSTGNVFDPNSSFATTSTSTRQASLSDYSPVSTNSHQSTMPSTPGLLVTPPPTFKTLNETNIHGSTVQMNTEESGLLMIADLERATERALQAKANQAAKKMAAEITAVLYGTAKTTADTSKGYGVAEQESDRVQDTRGAKRQRIVKKSECRWVRGWRGWL